MSRPLRLEHPGAIWHVTSRGNERRDIFRSDRDRQHSLATLSEVVPRSHSIVHAWVLMSNHYHLLLETPEPTLSSGVKRLNEVYAQSFNFRHNRVGHLFQGRFKAIHVERESHLLELARYVVLNPVRCGAVRLAGEYEWSSYRATAGLGPAPSWLTTSWTLAQFGSAPKAVLCERYRQFVADGRGAAYDPWENLIGQLYLGGEAFCDRMQRLVGVRRKDRSYPKPQAEFVRPSFDAIIE